MKLLMFNTKEFWFRTFRKTVELAEEAEGEEGVEDALVVFINVEKQDEERVGKVVKKAVNNIHWLARKVGRRKVVLHAFAHLSDSKSSVAFAREAIEGMRERLVMRGYEALVTPFGYFLEFRIHVLGESLAKVWKDVS